MSTIHNGLVEIVYDFSKGKLRARAVNTKAWVRFPKAKRVRGAIYRVEELRPSRGCYIACGDITTVQKAA